MKKVLILFLLLTITLLCHAQKHQLDGILLDRETAQPIPLGHVQVLDYDLNIATDQYGMFRIPLEPGTYSLKITQIAYENLVQSITITSDTVLAFRLKQKQINLDQVVISGERIRCLTRERYQHVSDYEILDEHLLIIGHPGKQNKSYLYLSGLSGVILDTFALLNQDQLISDYQGHIWLKGADQYAQVSQEDNQLTIGDSISESAFRDSIGSIILKMGPKYFFQYFDESVNKLWTYYYSSATDSVGMVSEISDSVQIMLKGNKARDHYARVLLDRASGNIPVGAFGASSSYSTFGSSGSRYITSANGDPLIYGSGNLGATEIDLPNITLIDCPIFVFKSQLVQIDYYNGFIYFFDPDLNPFYSIPITFPFEKQAGGTLRKIYHPLVDELNQKVYLWIQRMDQVKLYELDMNTGKLIRQINLEKYKNIKKLKIHKGRLYFMYSELIYPYVTRLFNMVLED